MGLPVMRWPARAARLILTVALIAAIPVSLMAPAASAASAKPAVTEYIGARILDQAETKTGDWYAYGAAGPSYFDCSGLVSWAARSLGLPAWPRDTYEIAAQIGRRFVITTHPVRGDLALWGPVSAPYHVEIVTAWYQTTFGAQDTGTRVGWHYHYAGWRPSFYLHILG